MSEQRQETNKEMQRRLCTGGEPYAIYFDDEMCLYRVMRVEDWESFGGFSSVSAAIETRDLLNAATAGLRA